MTAFYSTETRALSASPPRVTDGKEQGARVRVWRSTIPLDAPATGNTTNGTAILNGDTVLLMKARKGQRFKAICITTSVSLGSSTIAIGVSGTPAKYKAAAVLTATNTPTWYGLVSAMDDGVLTADEDIILTVAAADMPTTAGSALIVDLEFFAP